MTADGPRVVLVGNRALARHVLLHLLETGWNVVGAVATTGEQARKQAGFEPFDAITDAHDIALIEAADIHAPSVRDRLAELNPAYCICPGWHQVIDESVLKIPTQAFLGFHSSDLPRGRGGAPINWSLIHGDDRVPICLFRYVPAVDGGDIVVRESVVVEERDDVQTILDKLAVAACDALDSVRTDFEDGTLDPTPQSVADATYRPRRQPQDGLVDWTRSAVALSDWVRAQTDPYPGAYTFVDGRRLTIWTARAVATQSVGADPGTVVAVHPGDGIDVATAEGVLRVERVQPRDRPRMWADAFTDRFGVAVGDTFGRHHAPPSWRYTGIRDRDGGTDFTSATNLAVGETGTIRAVVGSGGADRAVDVMVTLDGDRIFGDRVSTTGWESCLITYDPTDPGSHTLAIEFATDGSVVDGRYLKVFVH
ncbi:methionyl-tRNA formyltransferase [Haloplanus aerogenes]|uniref:Methionyl-tRNA formyltransferase n=1 Tax=Haloplanus aerogenes TaxID=660522 RepID=A0A3M0DH44_9EURY|nr:methionyl-tRNA formyltransferase [Haloplanus aerogenes]RMB18216.1 methionyl-tRNA formyltransferase [Haloplanus aerogenes]